MADENEEVFCWEGINDAFYELVLQCKDQKKFIDCKLFVGGDFGNPELIGAHRAVLCNASKFFEITLKNRNSTKRMPWIALPSIRAHIMRHAIDFIYKGIVIIPQSDVDQFIEAASTLQLSFVTEVEGFGQNRVFVRERLGESPGCLAERARLVHHQLQQSLNPPINNRVKRKQPQNPIEPLQADSQVISHSKEGQSESDASRLREPEKEHLDEQHFEHLTIADEEELENLVSDRNTPSIQVFEIPNSYRWYEDINFSPLQHEIKTCEICLKPFRDKYSLDVHKLRDHNA